MPSARRSLGDFGEQAAHAYLIRQGYSILGQNWRCALGEIDLIALDGDEVVVVEVRTRRSSAEIAPEETLSRAKCRRLIALATTYMAANNFSEDTSWRIDVVALVLDSAGRIARLTHLISAVEELAG